MNLNRILIKLCSRLGWGLGFNFNLYLNLSRIGSYVLGLGCDEAYLLTSIYVLGIVNEASRKLIKKCLFSLSSSGD